MNTNDIQARIDAMPARMSAKGLRSPEVTFNINANKGNGMLLSWVKPGAERDWDREYRHLSEAEKLPLLDAADALIAALPSAEETKHRAFMDALGSVIDLGRQNGIEVAFVNPLVETMKRLSENVLTFQPGAAE